jgi:hypothetical protein
VRRRSACGIDHTGDYDGTNGRSDQPGGHASHSGGPTLGRNATRRNRPLMASARAQPSDDKA